MTKDSKTLSYLAPVIECGSLRSASRHLDISQPTLSKSIERLERELGSKLLERGAAGVVPTPLGEILYSHAPRSIQREGRPVEEIRPGDVVQIPPGVRHWHGAAAATGMTHISLTEEVDGRNATWMGKVTDEQYRR
jgi:hypothetical protein